MRPVKVIAILSLVILLTKSIFADPGLAKAYQLSHEIKAKLALILQSQHIAFNTPTDLAQQRQLRHVYDQARIVLGKIRRFKELQRIPYRNLADVTPPQLTLINLNVLLIKINDQINEIAQFYALPLPLNLNVNPVTGKANFDTLYQNLCFISAQLDELSGVSITPKDVYMRIITIVDDLEKIRAKKQVTTAIPDIPFDPNKTPTDVYNSAYRLLEKLQQLSQKPGFTITGGIVLPPKKTGRLLPKDVIELLNIIQTEVNALKLTSGIQEKSQPIATRIINIPPYVYQQVVKAIELVDSLL